MLSQLWDLLHEDSFPKLWPRLYSSSSKSFPCSGSYAWPYRPIGPLVRAGPNQFVPPGTICLWFCTAFWMLQRGIFVVCVAFPATASSSNYQSLVWGVRTSSPIDIGERASYVVLVARLSLNTEGFQTVSTSTFYVRASLLWSPDVYSTIWGCCAQCPFQCTLLLLFQYYAFKFVQEFIHWCHSIICWQFPCLYHYATQWSNHHVAIKSVLSLRATGSTNILLLHLNPKYKSCHTPMRFSHMQSSSLDPSLTPLSSK